MWSDLLFPLAVVFVWLCIFTLVISLARWFTREADNEAAATDSGADVASERHAVAG